MKDGRHLRFDVVQQYVLHLHTLPSVCPRHPSTLLMLRNSSCSSYSGEGCFDWLAQVAPLANHVLALACGMCLRMYFTYVLYVQSLHMALIGLVETASRANGNKAVA